MGAASDGGTHVLPAGMVALSARHTVGTQELVGEWWAGQKSGRMLFCICIIFTEIFYIRDDDVCCDSCRALPSGHLPVVPTDSPKSFWLGRRQH